MNIMGNNWFGIIWVVALVIFILLGIYQSTKKDTTEEDLADKAENERLAKEAKELNEGFKN